MYLSWEFVGRAGPDSGYRVSPKGQAWATVHGADPSNQSKEQSLEINPTAKTYREWLKTSTLVKDLVAKLKAAA